MIEVACYLYDAGEISIACLRYGFIKKSQRIPAMDLELAKRRLAELQEGL
jgi:hypothetical protein